MIKDDAIVFYMAGPVHGKPEEEDFIVVTK